MRMRRSRATQHHRSDGPQRSTSSSRVKRDPPAPHERMAIRNIRRRVGHATASEDQADREDTQSNPRRRFYLELDDDIVAAPSIGPRTAERLRPQGLRTVRDLLAADVDAIAPRIGARHITSDVIANWQDQARLVLTVPYLRGTHAQILVGAGYRTPDEVAAAERNTLLSDIMRFAATRDGQSVLRNGQPPDLDKILVWMRNAADAELDRIA
jgi:predicted flap endonuclease-1-like 5' DNA nuclease